MASWESTLEFFNIDRSITIGVKCVESVLDILFCDDFLMVYCGCEKLLVVDLTITVEVAIGKDLIPFVAESNGSLDLFFGRDELFFADVTVSICV